MASGDKSKLSSGMTFFKELRRRSKAGFHSKPAAVDPPCLSLPTSSAGESDINGCGGLENGNGHLNGHTNCNGNGNGSANGNGIAKSSTTDSSVHSTNNTPPPSIKRDLSSNHLPYLSKSEGWLPPPTQRNLPIATQSCRNSIVGVNSIASNAAKNFTPTSPYAPRVHSVSDNSWVNQKLLLLYGHIGDREPQKSPIDGTITIHHLQDSFPSIPWPVRASCFKALVHLVPGPNRIRLEFNSPKAPGATSHTSWININYLPLVNSPPLQLAILLGSDSDAQYDSVPNKGTNDLDNAVRKFRMAAYLWQAFTSEQMFRNSFGRRCFHLEEEWQTGSLSGRDAENGIMRSEAKIHIIRCDKTVEELRALSTATTEGGLFKVTMDAVRKHFDLRPGEQRYVSVLLLDTHWDNDTKSLEAHAALGSSQSADLKLALFGSHGLHSYPSCIQDIVSAFSDCTRTDTTYVANPNNECGSAWETASSSLGRHLHEIGHLFGCHDAESGIMGPDYLRFNRTFMTWEPYSTRTKEQGARLLLQQDECAWHRLDVLRFRFHPCFRLPSDPPPPPTGTIQVWPVDSGKTLISSSAGIAFVELYTTPDNDTPTSYIEYADAEAGSGNLPKQISFTDAEIRGHLPDHARKAKHIRLRIYSGCLTSFTVADMATLKGKNKEWTVKVPTGTGHGQLSYRGYMESAQGERDEVVYEANKLLTTVKVFAGDKLGSDAGVPSKETIAGIEFRYEDGSSQLFGSKGQGLIDNEYVLDSRRGEIIMGFNIRADKDRVYGVGILTSFEAHYFLRGDTGSQALLGQ
ncbi:uncharacterized protein GIQ15_00986 [Arthroderma uncinatum]|uniref:uncharacterized protein n=1 Tax=Arthroderma uncinatum TaxID=74035 RepID=UPI00144AB998|nr:uncharacterized protein GIQ15_00986 [Arthroderma uncinatum]KAF3491469.1 hypothetical protein GIQ15_00986 [Arthroderma uncinatum]